ncbi:MAG: hypothetical protein F4099_00790 [Synechococcus sp. SB0673_bin_10]|nr:hypothetical protein [Cyanobacteria bacterium MAG IRC3_bin_20]MDE0647829.1 hypothetical protein [Cyanobacteria bacterium MAG IRC4_bin_6]MYG64357.1 hypothetical protein [Synechococcus sp. SB0675_bin_7]MYI71064.1 hypothetical protein [Synechococcus sp. SB0673_bin_10]MYK86319.1 hypothetical protein [Synechococcus sp. SB0669_bin_7]
MTRTCDAVFHGQAISGGHHPLPLQLPHPLPRPAIHLQHQLQIRRAAPILTVLVTGPFDVKPS